MYWVILGFIRESVVKLSNKAMYCQRLKTLNLVIKTELQAKVRHDKWYWSRRDGVAYSQLEERPGEKGYELARQLNISCGSLSGIVRGKNLPSASTLASIHLNTNLNVGYVLTGQIAGKKKSALRSLVVEVDDKVFNVVLKRKNWPVDFAPNLAVRCCTPEVLKFL